MLRVLILVALAAVTVYGCGGGTERSPASAGSVSNETSADLDRLLEASIAKTFSSKTYEMTATIETTAGGSTIRASSVTRFREPNDVYANVDMSGLHVQILSLPPEVYVRKLGGDWSIVDRAAQTSFTEVMKGNSLSDYQEVIENLTDVVTLADEDIDGTNTRHVQATFDIGTYLEGLSDGSIDPEMIADARREPAPQMDLWVDPETQLIRRWEMRAQFETPAGEAQWDFVADLGRFGDADGFPDRPVGAPAFQGF